MRKQIIAETVVVKKEGVSASNKAWTISTVTDQNGDSYDTFENMEEGKAYSVEVTKRNNTGKNGKIYTNLTITKIYPPVKLSVAATVAPKTPQEAPIAIGKPYDMASMEDALNRIELKLDEILARQIAEVEPTDPF